MQIGDEDSKQYLVAANLVEFSGSQMVAKDLYETLGLHKGANPKEIKSAYYQVQHTHAHTHPIEIYLPNSLQIHESLSPVKERSSQV